MELILRDNLKIIDVNFGHWICRLLKHQIISRLNVKSLINLDGLLQTISNDESKNSISTEKVIYHLVDNFYCCGVDGNVVIKINSNPCPGFSNLDNNTIAKLINYGNRDCKGSFIFTNAFEYVKQNLSDYISYFYDV